MAFSDAELNDIQRVKALAAVHLANLFNEMSLYSGISFNGWQEMCNHIVLTGGAFASWLNSEEPKDIDIYILDGMDECMTGLNYGHFADVTSRMKAKVSYDATYHNKNIKGVENFPSHLPWQIIYSKFKTREELMADFDYKHCTISYYEGMLYMTETAYRSAISRVLVPNNRDRLTALRQDKFLSRGWAVEDKDSVDSVAYSLFKAKRYFAYGAYGKYGSGGTGAGVATIPTTGYTAPSAGDMGGSISSDMVAFQKKLLEKIMENQKIEVMKSRNTNTGYESAKVDSEFNEFFNRYIGKIK